MHPAVRCLEDALRTVQTDIENADGAIGDFRRQIEARKKRLAVYYKDRNNLIDALALVRKRVGEA